MAEARNNSALLLTGASGFLGKVVLEKHLREGVAAVAPLPRLYVLLRPANGRAPAERLAHEVLGSAIFDRLRDELGEANFEALAARRVVAVGGDLGLADLGLSAADAHLLAASVGTVLHLASAHAKDAPRAVLRVNVLGTLALLRLAQQWEVRSFTYASSAFVSCGRPVGTRVEEQLYPLHITPEQQRELVACARDEEIGTPLPAWWGAALGPFPDLATLAKAIAERMVAERRGTLPVAIVRPSMLGA